MKSSLARFGSFVVIVGALLGLGYAGQAIYDQMMAEESPARILSASNIALYAEMDLTGGNKLKWDNLLKDYPSFQVGGLEQLISDFLELEGVGSELKVIALVLTDEKEPVLLISGLSKGRLKEIEERMEAIWIDDIVTAESRALSWTQKGDYVVFASNGEILQRVLDNRGERLEFDPEFIRIQDGLPKGALFVYMDGERLIDNNELGSPDENTWESLAKLVQQGGAVLDINDDGFLIKTKTVYDEDLKAVAGKVFSRVKSVRDGLANLFPTSTVVFYESADLQADFRDAERVLRSSSPVLSELWQRRKAYWEQGMGLSLMEDILEIADGPYALALVPVTNKTGSGEMAGVGVFHNEETFLREKMRYFDDLLLRKIPAMYPEMAEIQLVDGNTAEVMRVGDAVKGEVTELGGVTVSVLEFPDLPVGLSYAIDGDDLILATHKQALIEMIVARDQEGGLLTDRDDFDRGLSRVNGMRSSLFWVDLEELDGWFSADWQKFVAPFSTLTGGKNLMDFESLATWQLMIRDNDDLSASINDHVDEIDDIAKDETEDGETTEGAEKEVGEKEPDENGGGESVEVEEGTLVTGEEEKQDFRSIEGAEGEEVEDGKDDVDLDEKGN